MAVQCCNSAHHCLAILSPNFTTFILDLSAPSLNNILDLQHEACISTHQLEGCEGSTGSVCSSARRHGGHGAPGRGRHLEQLLLLLVGEALQLLRVHQHPRVHATATPAAPPAAAPRQALPPRGVQGMTMQTYPSTASAASLAAKVPASTYSSGRAAKCREWGSRK